MKKALPETCRLDEQTKLVEDAHMKSLEELQFHNTYARLPDEFFNRVIPIPLHNAHLISFNPALAEAIDLAPDQARRPEFVEYLLGIKRHPGMEPLAMCYSGHQFGVYVPRLGDGRAILLGQVKNSKGESWDLHLKGSGPTLYSRGADGRAVLRSSIREYLCSEAMHGLGIPTTRALCLMGSDEPVYRETIETGAMVLRMAPSHIRFGHFEYFYYTNQHHHLKTLADYVIATHWPQLVGREDRYLALLDDVISRTASLIAQWQGVGFAHGVMNSDNMSLLGLTLDYGPFGFIDTFDAGFICNHSDHHGRYAFDQQPAIGLFNLTCLAQALLPLLTTEPEAAAEQARSLLGEYQQQFFDTYHAIAQRKLGLRQKQPGDEVLWRDLLNLLQGQADYTRFMRVLCEFDSMLGTANSVLRDQVIDRAAFDVWAERYRQRLQAEQSNDQERCRQMRQANPKYILRNYLAEQAIRAAADKHDYSEIETLLDLLRNPYAEQPERERYAAAPPEWAQRIEVSCSS